eukprot:IDg2044t1
MIVIGVGEDLPSISARSLEIQIYSLAAEQEAMYLASHVDVAITVCFFDLQQTAPAASRKIKPSVDFRDSVQPPQSESLYLIGLANDEAVDFRSIGIAFLQQTQYPDECQSSGVSRGLHVFKPNRSRTLLVYEE